MVKYIIYGLGILMIVGLGLFMELNSGDYMLVEQWRSHPTKISQHK